MHQASRGCPFCGLIISRLNKSIAKISSKKDLWIYIKMYNSFRANSTGFNRLRVYVGPRWQSLCKNNIYDELEGVIYFSVVADPCECCCRKRSINISLMFVIASAAAKDQTVCRRYLGGDLRLDKQISAFESWLEDCLGYDRCVCSMSGLIGINAKMTLLPTRCIDVSLETPKLKVTKQHERGSYLILSHY